MTPNEYQQAALRTEGWLDFPILPKYFWIKRLENGLMGMCGESGEAIDILKKYMFQGHELDKEHLAKEIGDVLWYAAVSAHALGYSLEDIMQMNIDKLKARYPDGFKVENSVHRVVDDM